MRLQILSLCAVFALVGCASDDVPRATGDTHDDSVALHSEALQTPAAAYFVGRQDVRRCRWPLCGGYWVRQVNRPYLRCPDGSVAAECYVALLDTEALGAEALGDFGNGTVVARATFGSGDAGEFGAYALLRVQAAWRAATDAPARGDFHLLEDNGIVCVRAPCFSWTAQRLNSAGSRTFSDLDLSAAGASEKQLELARLALSERGLVSSGRFARSADGGVRFVASQFHLPVAPVLPSDECLADEDCTLSMYTAPVSSAADCYCPTCPIPQTAALAALYAAGWQTYCAETHGFEVCPPPPCPFPPPVACNAGACGFSFDGPQP